MRTISSIIDTLSTEEQQEFLGTLKKKTRRSDAKNGMLFKLIASGHTNDLDVRLYGKPSKNAYHALCKRLQDSLIDFVASKSFLGETSEELEILKLLLASRIFFEQKQLKVAIKTLEKAEKKALQTDLYSILNEIYQTKTQYAHLNGNWILSEVITASEQNMRSFQQELQLNRAYAAIKSELKNKGTRTINERIIAAFSRFHIQIDETLTYKSLFQLMEITTTSAKLQRDFYTVSPFMVEIYGLIAKKGTPTEKHRFYHIKILNLMAVNSFRNKQFQESGRFAEAMEVEMRKEKKRYYRRFEEKLKLIRALNLNYTGHPDKAIDVLKSFEGHSYDIELIRAMCFFQQGDFSRVYIIIKGFVHSDDWYEKKMDWMWVLKKNIMEILVLIELDHFDLVLLRIQRFKRRFSKQLGQIGEKRVLTFIRLIENFYESPKVVTTDDFKDKVENSFEWLGKDQEDIFVMSFYAWLKAKMENKNLYGITLELVGQRM